VIYWGFHALSVQILDDADELIVERGVEEVSLYDMAEHAGDDIDS
jgi:AcrR family transcriptional regulator